MISFYLHDQAFTRETIQKFYDYLIQPKNVNYNIYYRYSTNSVNISKYHHVRNIKLQLWEIEWKYHISNIGQRIQTFYPYNRYLNGKHVYGQMNYYSKIDKIDVTHIESNNIITTGITTLLENSLETNESVTIIDK